MKLRFNRQETSDALSALGNVASGRTPKEILRCVRMEARSDLVLLSATDLELSLRCAVTQVEVGEPGEAVVHADTLARIVRECADEVLNVETEGHILHIRGVGSHFQVVTHDPAEFPPVPGLEGAADFSIESNLLRRLVEWTVFAAARESTRYAINGVLWELHGAKLTLAATDGRRLSVARAKLPIEEAARELRAIVPTKALLLLGRLPTPAGANVDVKITGNQLFLRLGGAMLGTSLVEGLFPKYDDVIPRDCDRVVELNTGEFTSALKRAALLTNEESKGVRLAFSDGDLTLSSRAPEQGEATVSMPIRYRGEAVEIGFNPIFLLDALRVIPTEQLSFAFKEPTRPGMIRLGDDFLYVVMPVNLSSA